METIQSGTRPTINELGPMSSRRPQGVSSRRGIHGKRPRGVWRRNSAIPHGGYEEWNVVSGGRRRGGMFCDEVAHGLGGEQLATPRSRGRLE